MIQLQQSDIDKLQSYITDNQNITIISHTNPDGDTIGAALALANLLIQLNKSVKVIVPDEIPDFLQFLPNAHLCIDFSVDAKSANLAMENADLLFCVDYNAAHRTGKFSSVLEKSDKPKIMIDHHLFPDSHFFNLLFSYPESSSTSELLFLIIEALKLDSLINESVAMPLLVGIITDTGSFAHSCDRSEVFETTAKLIKLGNLKVKSIHDQIYNNFKENRLRFLGFCISEKLVVLHHKNAAYIWVTLDEMAKYSVSEGDLEGVVNYALSIQGIELAVLLKEKTDTIKLSFRSKSRFNVNQFARDYFNGGGHFNAAGGKSYDSMQDSLNRLNSILTDITI